MALPLRSTSSSTVATSTNSNKCSPSPNLPARRGSNSPTISKGPAVILDVGEFDPRRAGRFGDGEHLFEFVDVATVDDEVERNGNAMLPQPFEHAELLRMGLRAGDFVGGIFTRALEAQLNVVEPGIHKSREFCFIEGQAGGDEIDVEAGGARGADEFDDVGARERFAAGEIGLKDTGFGGFLENARPDLGSEFCRARLQFQRVRAIDAMQRATVGEFSDERQRIGYGGCHVQKKWARGRSRSRYSAKSRARSFCKRVR